MPASFQILPNLLFVNNFATRRVAYSLRYRQTGPPRERSGPCEKKFAPPPSKGGGPAVFTQNQKDRLSLRKVTWAWSETANLYNR